MKTNEKQEELLEKLVSIIKELKDAGCYEAQEYVDFENDSEIIFYSGIDAEYNEETERFDHFVKE